MVKLDRKHPTSRTGREQLESRRRRLTKICQPVREDLEGKWISKCDAAYLVLRFITLL